MTSQPAGAAPQPASQPDPTLTLLQLFDASLSPTAVDQAVRSAAGYDKRIGADMREWAEHAILLGILRELRGSREQQMQLHNVVVQGLNGIMTNQEKLARALQAVAEATRDIDGKLSGNTKALGEQVVKLGRVTQKGVVMLREAVQELGEELTDALAGLEPAAPPSHARGGEEHGSEEPGGDVPAVIDEFEDDPGDGNFEGIDAEASLESMPDEIEEPIDGDSEAPE